MGGHLSAIDAVLDTFDWLPVGQHRDLSGAGPLIADLLTHGFSFALRVGAPIVVAVLVARDEDEDREAALSARTGDTYKRSSYNTRGGKH